MTNFKYLALAALSVVAFSCEDNENLRMGDHEVTFDGKNAVVQSQDLSNLRIKNLSGDITIDESVPQGQMRIASDEDVAAVMEVKTENGELRFEGHSTATDSVDLDFYINPLDLEKIVVEGDNRIYISSTPVLDYLEIITEGSSILTMDDLKVRELKSRREGKSQMYLSGEVSSFASDSVYFADSLVVIEEDRFIFYTDNDVDYVLVAPVVEIRNDSVFALAAENDPLRTYFITGRHEMVNQGESYLDALELPVISAVSKNEGKSEAKVWVLDHLEVKGEGESQLYYHGNPEIQARLEGSAIVEPLE